MLRILPQEIETWYIIPAIRRELARELVKRGLSQRAVAARLGITESAISQYIKDKRATKVALKPEMLEEIKRTVDSLLAGGDAFNEVYRLSLVMKKDMTICEIHRTHEAVPQQCTMCYDAADPVAEGRDHMESGAQWAPIKMRKGE
ncbi:MAG: helix-turn-helix domain-containing protein [Candidatus Aenigmarchaeota archaeon]|nr:helix-turn-helix domain-containing protein [Candidatus Aenigmarchaeota archaeon]